MEKTMNDVLVVIDYNIAGLYFPDKISNYEFMNKKEDNET